MPGLPPKSSVEARGEARLSAPLAVELGLRNRQEFMAGFDASASPGGAVFCPTRRKASKGAPVTVRVNLGRR